MDQSIEKPTTSKNAKRPHDEIEKDSELNKKSTKHSKTDADVKFDEQQFYDNYDDKQTLFYNLKKLPFKKREQMYSILIEQLRETAFGSTNLTEIRGYSNLPRKATRKDNKDNNNNKIRS